VEEAQLLVVASCLFGCHGVGAEFRRGLAAIFLNQGIGIDIERLNPKEFD